MGNYGKARTGRGYPLDEATSALHKAIRRGQILEAAFWAFEMSSYFHDYVWHRLITAAHEDIGIADPQAAIYVETCKQQYFDALDHGKEMELALINAAAYLAYTVKCRLADEVLGIICKKAFRMEVPDEALDLHTRRGRNMGRTFEDGLKTSILLVNEHPDPALQEFRKLWMDKYLYGDYEPWYVEWHEKRSGRKQKKGRKGPDENAANGHQLPLLNGDAQKGDE